MNCGECKYARGLINIGKIRCFCAHKTIAQMDLIVKQKGNLNIPAPSWCPKPEDYNADA